MMEQRTTNRWIRGLGFFVLALCLAGAGCRGAAVWNGEPAGEGPDAEPGNWTVPPVDRKIPGHRETATFAAG